MLNISNTTTGDISRIFTAARITEVYVSATGQPLRFGRGKATWRTGANGYNVSFNDEKGVYFDHVTGTGGGVLALIELAQNCSRKDALQWLADFTGIQLQTTTPAQQQNFARRRAAIESQAADLCIWVEDRLIRMTEERDDALDRYRISRKFISEFSLEHPDGPIAADIYEAAEKDIERLDAALDHHRQASMDEHLREFRKKVAA